MKVARFRFDPSLHPLLPKDKRGGRFDYAFKGRQSVKHLIEALGVPHTEIGNIHADGRGIGLGYLVSDGDQIEVHAVSPGEESSPAGTEPRFVLDNHLGRLAAYLRMLGLDSLYRSDFDDKELAQISAGERRILLTRDRRLLMHKTIRHGYLLRSLEPAEQLREVVWRYRLERWIKPFQRCLRCNAPLEPVNKEAILHRLEPLTKKYYDEFHRCTTCDQVYWKGSHYERMLGLIEAATREI